MLNEHTVIFGGSFDPPHSGHAAMIGWLLNSLNAKKVMVCPTAMHCFGKDLAPFDYRLTMCELMVRPFKNRARVSDIEYFLPKPNLTYNLLNSFKDAGDDKLAVVIGADNLNQIDKWEKWDEVIKIAKVVAVGRPGYELKDEYPFDVDVYPVGISTISSTEVKERVSKYKKLDGFVPHEVNNFILDYGVYR